MDADGAKSSSQYRKLNIGASSYIWRPWFVQVMGNLQLTQTETANDNSDSISNGVFGDATFSMFPVSRFPGSVYFEKRLTEREYDSDNLAQDNTGEVLRYGFEQSYRPATAAEPTRYNARYNHLEDSSEQIVEQDGELNSVTDFVQDDLLINFTGQRGRNDLEAQLSYYLTGATNEAAKTETQQTRLELEHGYPTKSRNAITNHFNYFNTEDSSRPTSGNTAYFDAESSGADLSSSYGWASSDLPLNIGIGVSLSNFSLARNETDAAEDVDVDSEIETDSLSNFANIRYQYDDDTRLELSHRGTQREVTEDTNGLRSSSLSTESVQEASYDRSGEFDPFMDFSHSWNADLSGQNFNHSDRESYQSLSGGARHYLGKSEPLSWMADAIYSMTFSQNFYTSRYSRFLAPNSSLGHGFTATINQSREFLTNSMSLSLSDQRSFSSFDTIVQNASYAHNTTYRFDHSSQVAADLSIQKSWVTVSGGDTNQSDENVGSSLNLSYGNNKLFQVRNLSFLSELGLSASSLTPWATGEYIESSRSWRNQLQYTVGLLVTHVEMDIYGEDFEYRQFRLNIKRFF